MQVERSVLGRHWRLRPCDEAAALAISQRHGLPELLGRVLAGRGIGPAEAAGFLNPRLRDWLPDPSHLRDLDRAAERLAAAILALGANDNARPEGRAEVAVFEQIELVAGARLRLRRTAG